MAEKYVINVDLAKFTYKDSKGKDRVQILGWGDTVDVDDPVNDISAAEIKAKLSLFRNLPDNSVQPFTISGVIKPPKGSRDVVIKKAKNKVLKIDFVDVQQGDGAVIETPEGKVILIDGGDNQLFARYLANRFQNTSDNKPKFIDCVLITHGDADHFVGLTKMAESETTDYLKNSPLKRIFLCPERVYHNGLVKRPGTVNKKKVKDEFLLGATTEIVDPESSKKIRVITELEENLLSVTDSKMNEPFFKWKSVLAGYEQRLKKLRPGSSLQFKRLERGMDSAFDFLDADIKVKVLAPITHQVGGKSALKFLRKPPSGPRTAKEFFSVTDEGFGRSLSAAHTINGHSIVFQMRYGDFTFMFSGDLNDEAERVLTQEHNRNQLNLQSDVLKVPHHGSHDFSGAFLQAVAPVISVISSGDESARKEYIHPRANLLGALGRFSRIEEPIIFITELVAFFQVEGWIRDEYHELTAEGKKAVNGGGVVDPNEKDFFAFSRAAFGLVRVRTDGKRILVYTNSALSDMNEAYAFEMDDHGKPVSVQIIKA